MLVNPLFSGSLYSHDSLIKKNRLNFIQIVDGFFFTWFTFLRRKMSIRLIIIIIIRRTY